MASSQDHGELFQWHRPDVFFSLAETGLADLGRARLSGNEAKPFREAWILSRAAILIGAEKVRLEQSPWPDGWLQTKQDDGCIPVEVTELLQSGRKRGKERPAPMREVHQLELDAAIECNAAWLQQLIAQKVCKSKNYAPNTVLLVYLNTSLFNFDPDRTTQELERAADVSIGKIAGVLILYEGRLYGRKALQQLTAATR